MFVSALHQNEISMNDKFEFKDERWKHQLIIADIQEEDSAVYSCKCGTTETSCKLNVEITWRVSHKKKAGTHYPSRAPVFTPGFWCGPCFSSF
jgi:hypothetical protein